MKMIILFHGPKCQMPYADDISYIESEGIFFVIHKMILYYISYRESLIFFCDHKYFLFSHECS